jgi:hypothetical protein
MKRLICLIHLLPFYAAAQVQGPLDPSASQNTMCPFSYSSPTGYSNGNNAFASDNAYATASHCDCCDMNTQCFETTGFGFSIPGTAIIDGIMVEVEKKASPNSMVQDNGVKLLKAGNVVGLSYASSSNWPMTDTYSTYGGATDLWGAAWTPADINDPNFGLAFASISYTCFGNNQPVISSIDHVRITVYYTDVTGVNGAAVSSGDFLISPNPSAGSDLTITLPHAEKQVVVSVRDVTASVQVNDAVFSMELPAGLAKGIYVVGISGTRSYFGRLAVD